MKSHVPIQADAKEPRIVTVTRVWKTSQSQKRAAVTLRQADQRAGISSNL